MNDATCYSVSAAKVLAEGAYLLFYVRTAARHYVPIATQVMAAHPGLHKEGCTSTPKSRGRDIARSVDPSHFTYLRTIYCFLRSCTIV
jgi:hypothetical protein